MKRAEWIGLVLVAVLPVFSMAQQQPHSSRIEGEGARVTLILLDVPARDDKGRPLTGLTLDDFTVTLDGRPWHLYSVDSFCAPEAPARGASRPTPLPSGPGREDLRYILYLDLLQLQLDGRMMAIRSAQRWVREVMQPGDQAMVVASTRMRGAAEVCPLTGDRQRLIDAMERAFRSRDYVESFPAELTSRADECRDCIKRADCYPVPECCVVCQANAEMEARHGGEALRVLKWFLEELQEQPGRKVLLLFQQNGMISPAGLYPGSKETVVGTHHEIVKDVTAEANMAHIAVYAIPSGMRAAPGVGTLLADNTGGRYSRGTADIGAVLQASRSDTACVYRLAFEPPEASRSSRHDVRVRIRGVKRPVSYVVQNVNEVDRLGRRARASLRRADDGSTGGFVVALVPRANRHGRWSLALQVAVDADRLFSLPGPGGSSTSVDVGAILDRDEGAQIWEMLAGSQLRRTHEATRAGWLLFERVLDDLPAGHYRVRAFARDLALDVFQGGQALLELPANGKFGVTLPLLQVLEDAPHRRVPLILKGGKPPAPQSAASGEGPLPAPVGSVRSGPPLLAVSWLCPTSAGHEKLQRFVSRDGVPVFRLPPDPPTPDGDCMRITDRIDTAGLTPGRYAYHVRLEGGGQPGALDRTVAFQVGSE